jgi:hypothetical protein
MKRATREVLQDSKQRRCQHPGTKGDKDQRQPLIGFTAKRRALSPSAPHSKTYGH